MAYLRVSFDQQEIDRRDLSGSVVIGRSPECDLAVRDILLSRMHCRIELGEDGIWKGLDLSSKNGTLLNDQPLSGSVPLCDGDVVRLGRVRVRFFSGRLADAGLTAMQCPLVRPSDPTESLSATFVSYRYLEPGQTGAGAAGPAPRPSPRLPAAFEREDVHSLLTAIASSSWDSIYAQARLPLPTMAIREEADSPPPARQRPRSPIDLSLQVSPPQPDRAADLSPPRVMPRRPRSRTGGIALAACAMAILTLFVFQGWSGGLANPAALPAAAAHQRWQTVSAPPAPQVRPAIQPAVPLDPVWSAACQCAAATLPSWL